MKDTIAAEVLELAVQIQQIPAPTFYEINRAEFIRQKFSEQGLQDVSIDLLANVFARLPGKGNKPPLVLSAHLDTVFPAETDLTVTRSLERIAGPGVGDNSLGVAGLFGLIWSLTGGINSPAQTGLPGDIWLVANSGEEGLGDLRGMRRVVDRFQAKVCAYIILEGMALEQIYHRGLGVQRYRISAHTRGGHSWVDFGCPSAIHELAALINRITAIPVPGSPRSSMNIGVISGGTSVNTIASEARLELDLRSESPRVLKRMISQVEALVKDANRPGVEVRAEIVGSRPPGKISENHPLVQLAVKVLSSLKLESYLNIGSTDANIPLSQGLPAICIGLTHGSGAHTMSEAIQTSPVELGLRQLTEIVKGAFDL
ncbi:MAG: M20/M25/M40 family metallo-hydrolase [Chloroflexi bacterium]|nr:MAG: M20/M25/M40 family metallo-hydrolase [Chloroflexota bacterium]